MLLVSTFHKYKLDHLTDSQFTAIGEVKRGKVELAI